MKLPFSTLLLLALVVGLLILGSIAAWGLGKWVTTEKARRTVANLRARMIAWWVMSAVFVVAIFLGETMTVVMFALASFFAFREFITINPTKPADHRTLFLAFFLVIPLQYIFVGIQWYAVFSIFIPVYVFLAVPALIALAGDVDNYLARTSKIQWGLVTCVYFISHTPALLFLDLPSQRGTDADLLFVFVLLVELNDVMQYVTGTFLGSRPITPLVSPNKTWEGFIGGVISTTIVGAILSPLTPYSYAAGAAIAAAVAVTGFLGDIVMSAVKRDLGVKDFSNMIPGHGGALDRMDSLAFAAPLFFHLTRYFYSP